MTDNNQLDFWTHLLHLDGFRVISLRQDTPQDPVRLTLVPSPALDLCPLCHRLCDTIHSRRDSHAIKDLPACGQDVNLIFRAYQFECQSCHRFFT